MNIIVITDYEVIHTSWSMNSYFVDYSFDHNSLKNVYIKFINQ